MLDGTSRYCSACINASSNQQNGGNQLQLSITTRKHKYLSRIPSFFRIVCGVIYKWRCIVFILVDFADLLYKCFDITDCPGRPARVGIRTHSNNGTRTTEPCPNVEIQVHLLAAQLHTYFTRTPRANLKRCTNQRVPTYVAAQCAYPAIFGTSLCCRW